MELHDVIAVVANTFVVLLPTAGGNSHCLKTEHKGYILAREGKKLVFLFLVLENRRG